MTAKIAGAKVKIARKVKEIFFCHHATRYHGENSHQIELLLFYHAFHTSVKKNMHKNLLRQEKNYVRHVRFGQTAAGVNFGKTGDTMTKTGVIYHAVMRKNRAGQTSDAGGACH